MKSMNIEELEKTFDEIDRLESQGENIEVYFDSDSISSGNLEISLSQTCDAEIIKSTQVNNMKENLNPNVLSIERTPTIKQILLDISTSEIKVSDSYKKEVWKKAIENDAKLPKLKNSPIDDEICELSKKDNLTQPAIRQIRDTKYVRLAEDYSYCSHLWNTKGHILTAPTGFKNDLASIPDIFYPLIKRRQLSTVPAVFHDLLYKNGGVLEDNLIRPKRKFNRKEADDLFRELMGKSEVKKWRIKAAYLAVRLFSFPFWKNKG